MSDVKPEAKCVFCEKDLFPAPTDNSWVHIRYKQGICYNCVDRLHGVVHAKVLGEGQSQ